MALVVVVEEDGCLVGWFLLWREPVATQLAPWWLAWRQVKVESDLLR